MCRSVRHTPHALTRTRISSFAGDGTGRVSQRSGALSIGAGTESTTALTAYSPARASNFRARVRCGASTIWPLKANA